MPLKRSTVQTIQGLLLALVPLAILILVPDEYHAPLGWTGLIVGGGGLIAVKHLLKRLDKAGRLEEPGRKEFLTEIGMFLGMLGLMAFLLLIFVYGD